VCIAVAIWFAPAIHNAPVMDKVVPVTVIVPPAVRIAVVCQFIKLALGELICQLMDPKKIPLVDVLS
jgi:hypothetical protein